MHQRNFDGGRLTKPPRHAATFSFRFVVLARTCRPCNVSCFGRDVDEFLLHMNNDLRGACSWHDWGERRLVTSVDSMAYE